MAGTARRVIRPFTAAERKVLQTVVREAFSPLGYLETWHGHDFVSFKVDPMIASESNRAAYAAYTRRRGAQTVPLVLPDGWLES